MKSPWVPRSYVHKCRCLYIDSIQKPGKFHESSSATPVLSARSNAVRCTALETRVSFYSS